MTEKCQLLLCNGWADRRVSHPYRPEDTTALCADHAATAAEEIEGAEVIGGA